MRAGRTPVGNVNKKKSVGDYLYYLGSAKQASDYDNTTRYLINHIQKTFTYGIDIGKALEELKPCELSQYEPTITSSTAKDEATRTLENRRLELKYTADYDLFIRRVEAYESNFAKAYAFIWGQCTKAMQNKIENRNDFLTIKNNPIALLKAIKEHALNYEGHRYEMSIICNALRTMVNLKQQEGESLHDYTQRFMTSLDVLVSHIGGPIDLPKYMKTMKGYQELDQEKVTQCRETAFRMLMTFMYIDNSDKRKYGSLVNGLESQHNLGNNQYPTSIAEATQILDNHRCDIAESKKVKIKDGRQETKEESSPTLSFAQMDGKCYCCGKPGHKSPQCRYKNKPREEWAINKSKTEQQSHVNANSVPNQVAATNQSAAGSIAGSATVPQSSVTTSTPGWVLSNVQFYQEDVMRSWILLDNQSTVSIFCNPSLVTDIKPARTSLELATNGGTLSSNKKAIVPNYGEVWYHPSAITNIFSFAEMEDRYRITYDSSAEKAFIVHLPDRQIKFTRSPSGLYYYKPNYRTSTSEVTLVNSVEENKQLFTDRQVSRAKRARELYHSLGTPSLADFKAIMRMNCIVNNPVTIEDINIAEKIYGPDIGSLKGKTTRQKPAPVVSDYIEIPRQLYENHQEVVLCMDTMKINGIPFLTTVSRHIMYRTAEWVQNQTSQAYRSVLDNVFRLYNIAGFRITTIHCDNEYKSLMGELEDVYGVAVNYASAQEHVPEIERSIRVIKERVRATFHRLPYLKLPPVMIKILVMESTKKLNFFPPKGGISEFYSPRMIMHQENIHYDKHCAIPFGTYVQAHQEPSPTNTQEPRSLDCIYMRFLNNKQGGHEILDLRTERIITRRHVTPIPITQNVIDIVHAMATRHNMTAGIKVQTKAGITLYDSTWIAGVDYEDDQDPEYDGDPEYQPTNEAQDESESQSEPESDDEADDMDEIDPNELFDILKEQGTNPVAREQENDIEVIGDEEEQVVEEEPVDNPIEAEEQEANQIEADETNQIEADEDNDEKIVNDDIENNIENVNDDDERNNEAGSEAVNRNDEPQYRTTRSGRVSKPPGKYSHHQCHLITQGHKETQYSNESGRIAANVIHEMNHVASRASKKHHSFIETFTLKKGLAKFGQKGREAAFNEMKQLHDRVVFVPIDIATLTQQEKKRAMESLIFLVEKRDGRIKARTCANGSTQRSYVGKEDAASPTAITESILLTATIDAEEGRDVMTADIPNAFVQTDTEQMPDKERITMKIRGTLVDMLVELNSDLYRPHIVMEGKEMILYVQVLKALYGMLQSSLLFYKKLRADLEAIGFQVNPYDPCVANRIVNGQQHTVTWHVDDIKSSHKDPEINTKFLKWLEEKYGDTKLGQVKAVRGKRHDYLGMVLDYGDPGQVKIDMTEYVKSMINDFPEEIDNKKVNCPWNENLFKVDPKSPRLNKIKSEQFHTFVAKGLFASKRGRPDIQPAISFMTTRVKAPNEGDWIKLKRLMQFLKTTQDDVLTLQANGTSVIKWYLDAAFAVHPDYKGHTGATMTLGKGAIQSISTKQKINTRSSTEAELISTDDIMSKVIWTKLFLETQGYDVKENIIYRDNQSSMKLETNGKASSGKRTRHFNIRYFFITDLIQRKEVSIEYCPTDEMVADYLTKPLTGKKFVTFRQAIMNLP